jgi:hypothetical protein
MASTNGRAEAIQYSCLERGAPAQFWIESRTVGILFCSSRQRIIDVESGAAFARGHATLKRGIVQSALLAKPPLIPERAQRATFQPQTVKTTSFPVL